MPTTTSVRVLSPIATTEAISHLVWGKIGPNGILSGDEFHHRVTYSAGQKEGENQCVIVTVR